MRTIILTMICAAITIAPTHSQILQKISRTVEKVAEQALNRELEEKVTEATNQAIDSLLHQESTDTSKSNASSGVFGMSKASPAPEYTFKHKAVMRMTAEKDVMDIEYYLPESGNYFGTHIKDSGLANVAMTVLDIDREAIFTFMDNSGQKVKMAIDFDSQEEQDSSEYQIEDTGNKKTILGYHCKEYKVTGEELIANIWITKDVEARFPTYMYSKKKGEASYQEWIQEIDGWAMQMIMVDNSKKKPKTITIDCLSIESSDLIITSDDYNKLGF